MDNLFPEHISKEDIRKLPLLCFENAIEVVDTHKKCQKALQELKACDLIGFDTETKPTFNKGEYNPTALVQLATEHCAYLFRIGILDYPKPLFDLFTDDSVVKLGISIADDLKDLRRLRPFIPRGFVDLNHVAKEIGTNHIGVRKLAAIFLDGRISKSQQVTNWENEILTEAQRRYAATDAWICLKIHAAMRSKGYL
ncbi:MAG: 3'-5' exonuclease [Bacteroidota bacterium]